MKSNQTTVSTPNNYNYQLPKRKRVPSKHFQSIKELAKMNDRKYKKQKLNEALEDQIFLDVPSPQQKNNTISCILPGQTKKLRLSIIIKKKPITKAKKIVSVEHIEKEKKVETTKNKGLFAAILQVTNQLQEDDKKKQEIDVAFQQGKRETEKNIREARLKKQREEEEKYFRFYERYKKLNDKLEENMTDILTL